MSVFNKLLQKTLLIAVVGILTSAGLNLSYAKSMPGAEKVTSQKNDELLQAADAQLQSIQQKNELTKQHLEELKKEKDQQIINLQPKDISSVMLEQAELEVALAYASLDGARLAQAEALQTIESINAKINNLANQLQTITLAAGRTSAVHEQILALQTQLSFQKSLLSLQQKKVDNLTISLNLAQSIYETMTHWKNQLEDLHKKFLKQSQQLIIQEKEKTLQDDQAYWLDTLDKLNIQLQTKQALTAEEQSQIEINILKAQEKSNLIHLQLVVLHLNSQLAMLSEKSTSNYTVSGINNNILQANTILSELENIKTLINKKMQLLERRVKIEDNRKSQGLINFEEYTFRFSLLKDLLDNYQTQLEEIQRLELQTNDYIKVSRQELSKALSRRQGLPGFSLEAWESLLSQLVAIPVLAVHALDALRDQLVISYQKLNIWSILRIAFIEILWIWAWVVLKDILARSVMSLQKTRQNMSKNVIYIVARVMQKNLLGVFLVIGFTLSFLLAGVALSSFMPALYIAVVWFVFKAAIEVTRIILLENVGDASGKDVRLYRELKWALFGGGVLTTLTVLAHVLPVDFIVTDFLNRLFMIFMLVTAILLLRGWQVVPSLLRPYIDGTRPYLMKVIQLLSLLIPLIILSTGLIGFLGYVDFAWTIFKYEGIFLLIMSGYTLARGFLKDVMEWLSDFCIRRLRHGWLWTQAVLKPLDKILRIGLFIYAGVILFTMYGWNRDSLVVRKLNEILHLHIIDAKGLVVTSISVLEMIVAGAIIYWLTKWAREFSYRWLFSKTRDLGLRNSSATFTQYIVFMVSTFLALKIIGIDLSGVSYVLAGFAAGVGLGLRDLIKNYASGLLLLFERPVRAGDLVSIGDYEGEVMHIGMRAMTVKTWDHMEVLVPNAETFEKPFTNWTHLDSIVRTVIDIKVSRDDDPFKVQALIMKVLEEITDVVTDPSPQVFLKEMSESLLQFEVRYYVNLQGGRTRAEIRSIVLFAIFSTFAKHNIKAPFPAQDIYLKNSLQPNNDG